MKLSTFTAKLTSGRAKILSMAGGIALAGAALTLGAPAAGAQHIAFGVQFGGPRYVAPAPVYVAPPPVYFAPRYRFAGPGYYGHDRPYDWRARGSWGRSPVYGRPIPYRGGWR